MAACGGEKGAPGQGVVPPASVVHAAAPSALRALPARDARVDADVYDACVTIDTLLRRVPATEVRWEPVVPFDSLWPGDARRWACRVAAIGRMQDNWLAVDSLTVWFKARGWSDQTQISADGPDGTVFGVHRAGVTCLIEGRWDGGDDSDSTVVPSDTMELHLGCTRSVAADTIPRP
jgi:hypothetical protein